MKISVKHDKDKEQLGSLVAYELLPFNPRRLYCIYDVSRFISRGHHAHKNLKQLLFCTYGSIEVTLFDGRNKSVHILDNPTNFLEVGKMVWHTMKWLKKNSVLIVLASEQYDELDYIRDYDEFLRMVNK
jgi:dTDP-4-dehydrorhamnose 3,5-epimerase-like enzyme